jgi:outer membrane protein assembly factor BamD
VELDPGAQLRRSLAVAAVAAVALVLPACAGHQIDLQALSSASDQVVWEAGEKAMSKKDWESARQYFRRLIDAFPQSEHQPDARIALADSYFEEGGVGNYVLAVSSYREFLTLYPQHPKSDYAQFRAAESYFKQMNTPDRDQTATHQALEEYERLLDVYPQSTFVEPAREKIRECRQILARANYQVGYFYQKTRKSWRSAIGRYETIISEYPDFERYDEVLFRLSQCLAYSGRYAEARPPLGRLQTEFPQSPFVEEAKKLEATFPPPGVPAATPPAPAGPPAQGSPPTAPQSGPPPGA